MSWERGGEMKEFETRDCPFCGDILIGYKEDFEAPFCCEECSETHNLDVFAEFTWRQNNENEYNTNIKRV